MPKIHRDTYIRRTNEPNTCLYCGATIRTKARPHAGYGFAWCEQRQSIKPHFCTLRCVEYFAEAALKNDFRLKPCWLKRNDVDEEWEEVE